MGLSIQTVIDEAEKELTEEKLKAAKTKIKAKMKELDGAKAVVANIERELEDLYVTVGQDL